MSIAYKLSVVFGISFVCCVVSYAYKPHLLFVIGIFAFFLALLGQFIVSLVSGFFRYRQSSRWWIMPSIICVVFVLSARLDARVGTALADWNFSRHLAEYVKIVDDVKSGVIRCGSENIAIFPQHWPPRISQVMASREVDGSTIVIFSINTGWYAGRSGYLFNGCAKNDNCIKKFQYLEAKWNLRGIKDEWYQFTGVN